MLYPIELRGRRIRLYHRILLGSKAVLNPCFGSVSLVKFGYEPLETVEQVSFLALPENTVSGNEACLKPCYIIA